MEIFVTLLQQILFLGAIAITASIVWGRISFIASNIQRGKSLDRTDRKEERQKNMLLIAFGQRKMFEKPVIGLMHFVIYAGFLLINIEILEILLDGLFGQHRLFSGLLGGFYNFVINFFELLAFGVLGVCVLFLIRRNLLIIPRLFSKDLDGFPRLDANIILVSEIVLMCFLFTMNATDSILQTRTSDAVWGTYITHHFHPVGTFLISQFFIPLYKGLDTGTLLVVERMAWWLHILGIFSFSVYVTYSKHLHIGLAFPNTYFANLEPKGKFTNMDSVTKEVQSMLNVPITVDVPEATDGQIGRFGAKDVQDLTWKNLMDSYACTECGRCTASCPANITGKKLSPRKIMMDTRDRLEEVGYNSMNHGEGYDDGKSLYGDYISKEELMACTTCNACVEACPVNINPLEIIMELRRYVAMEESSMPASWNSMSANMENNGAPWAFSTADRYNWAEELLAKE
jgi:heterodisulfide reductase subunit C